jgi:hypothetical protein
LNPVAPIRPLVEKTPTGTSVGVDDPYEHAGVCDHLTGGGTCRLAFERFERDEPFAAARRTEDYACPVVAEASAFSWGWPDCPHFRSRSTTRECVRCGLEERRMAHHGDRPLLEEHHLAYPEEPARHEITVFLCRWCHAKVHSSWARVTDDVAPDPEALAAREDRRSREIEELEFRSASERVGDDD